ncbi:MAG: AMP-binding protein [Verrucomicrobia bacterium]|nr:AMP-binding protein [Verrucomicrobiota bacterium]
MGEGNHPSRDAIRARQWSRLQDLLRAIVPANPFYTRKLSGCGDLSRLKSLEGFSAQVPFTTKAELAADQLASPPYGTNLTFSLDRYTRCHGTSGTSGAPLRWLDTPESWDWLVANWLEVFAAAGATRADRIFFAFSFGPFIGFWLAFEAALRLGCLCLPGGGLSSVARLRMILEHGVTVLCCTPTYALRLAEVAATENIDLADSRVKTLLVAGEPGGSIPATRARLEQLWPGARVFDHHGMTEVGPVTHECPARPGVLHVLEAAYYAEIIDPTTGQPAPPGQTGELVLTTLGRAGSPLLRYRTGDLVKCGVSTLRSATEDGRSAECGMGPCACGRFDLALEGGILGRTDDMLVVRGVNIYPSAVEEVIRRCGGIAEFQVHVNRTGALTELHVTIEPYSDCQDRDALARQLERAFHTAFALRVPVTSVAAGVLPRFEMKARRWIKD